MTRSRMCFSIQVSVCYCLVLALTSCSGSLPEEGTARSTATLTEPPDTFLHGKYAGTEGFTWAYTAEEDSGVIRLIPSNSGSVETTLTTPGAGILSVATRDYEDKAYLLVAAIDAAGLFSLYRYDDANGDGTPDASTEALLLSSGPEEMYVTQVVWDESNRFYLLDARCQDVLRAEDMNQDGWADTLVMTPFARSADYPHLLDTRYLDLGDPGEVVALRAPTGRGMNLRAERDHVVYRDTDSDGVADEEVNVLAVSIVPFVYGDLYDDQTAFGVRGEIGRTVDAYRLDANGDPTIFLGSATITQDDDLTTIALSASLVKGEKIHVVYDELDATTLALEVRDAYPQILSLEPRLWKIDEGATVTIGGASLTSDMTLTLVTAGGNEYALTYTFIDSQTVTANVPILTDPADVGSGAIMGSVAAQDPNDGLSLSSCAICEAGG